MLMRSLNDATDDFGTCYIIWFMRELANAMGLTFG